MCGVASEAKNPKFYKTKREKDRMFREMEICRDLQLDICRCLIHDNYLAGGPMPEILTSIESAHDG